MSELTFKGDVVSKFGTYLPAPYIDRVELLDDRVTTYISLFFVASPDDTIDDTIITHLNNNINVYCMHAWRGASDVKLTSFGYSESDWQSVVSGKVNVFKALYEARSQALIAAFNAAQQTSISTNMNDESTVWSKTEDLYTEEGQRIIKFQTSVDYLFNTTDSLTFGTPINPLTITGVDPQFWYTFAFTSTYNYSQDSDLEKTLENTKLLTNKTSDISYEKVYSDGKIRRLYTQYFDADDVIYDDVPLRSLGGFLYKIDNITHDQIKTYFEDLVTNFQTRAEKTTEDSDELSDLEDMLNNISYALSEYGDTAEILTQLNYLRDLFPSKSNGDIVGKLYLRFRKRLYSANQAVEISPVLQGRITRNPKIVDSQSIEAGDFTATSYVDDWVSSNYLYDNTYISLITYLDDDSNNVYYNKGYFFFDYEKAYRETSELSTYINVNKLSQLWGLEPVYSKFRVQYAKLKRVDNTDDSSSTTLAATLYTKGKYPRSSYFNWSGTTTSTAGSAANSSLVLRNFLPVQESPWSFGSEEIQNYHMMCFEFIDEFGSRLPSYYDEYEVSVAIEDNSIEVLDALVEHYAEIIEELDSYVNSSKEDCAYDKETGDFKPFFIDAMDNLYGEILETSPWYRAAVLYNMHRELILNTFDGDIDALIENVQEIVDTIGPYTGNREVLETFQSNFLALYDELYVNSIPGYSFGSKSADDESDDNGVLAGTTGTLDEGAGTESGYVAAVLAGEMAVDTDPESLYGKTGRVAAAIAAAMPVDTDPDNLDDYQTTYDALAAELPIDTTPDNLDDFQAPEEELIAGEMPVDTDPDSLDDIPSFDADVTDDDNMLVFTNTYIIADTEDAAGSAGLESLDMYYVSYRDGWSTTGGFITIEWNDWVTQVETYQATIGNNVNSSVAASALYSWMADLMTSALKRSSGGWAAIMSDYEAMFAGDHPITYYEADGTLTTIVGAVENVDLNSALKGWLQYMWGAIKNDGVLEASDVSNGYSA